MNTAACCRRANSSSAGMPSRIDGVAENFSEGNIQLKRAFGNAGPVVIAAAAVVVVIDDDDDACILVVLEFR